MSILTGSPEGTSFESGNSRLAGHSPKEQVHPLSMSPPGSTTDSSPAVNTCTEDTIPRPSESARLDVGEAHHADVLRRRREAADVLAETLLDMWLAEGRARAQGRTQGQCQAPEGGARD